MKDKKIQEIEIDNIHLAAFLIAKKIPLVRVVRSGRMGIFYFDSERATPEIQIYMSGQAAIEPKAFVSAIRQLKMQIDECPMEFGNNHNRSSNILRG